MGKIDHLLQRPGSRNWVVRLQYPGGKATEKSLRTPDYREAVVRAGPIITAHKAALLAARPRLETIWEHEYEPGREHAGPDGGKIVATDRELIHIGHNGAITQTEPNGGPVLLATSVPRLGMPFPVVIGPPTEIDRPTVAAKNGDDAILEAYLKKQNITGFYEREARATWATFKSLCDKPLRDCDYEDGRKLVEHFEAEGSKRATIAKKIGWLRAAVRQNMKTKDGLKFNPFSNVLSKAKPGDKTKRLPLDDADIRNIKRNLKKRLSKSDQLLLRLLATTGMRMSEAFQIDTELKERGVRYVIVGQKTEQSLRRVPLPGDVLPYLPKGIEGRLFKSKQKDPEDAASKRLNRFLDDIGIVDKRKVIHSLRHRAQDRLRAAGCREEIRWALLGHEDETVAAGYGEGFPVRVLRKWIDKIGF